jgi:hypothetical protein
LSLLSRINRLADQFGSQDTPKRFVITNEGTRHGITCAPDGFLAVSVPCNPTYIDDPDCDVMEALKPEQRALIGPHDQVCILVLPPNGRDSERPNTRWL